MDKLKHISSLEGHAGAVYALCSLNNNVVLSGSIDKMVGSWDLKEKTASPFAIRMEHPIYSLAISAQSNMLIVGQSIGGLHFIDLTEKKEVRHIAFHSSMMFYLNIIETRNQLVACSGDGKISLWNIEDQSLVTSVDLNAGKLRYCDVQNDRIAVACGDGSIVVMDLMLNTLHTISAHEGSAYSCKFSPDGKFLITGGKDAHIKIWHLEDGFKLVRSIPAHNYAIYDMAFDTSGAYLFTASRDKTIKMWSTSGYELIQRIDHKVGGHKNSVNRLLWNPELGYLISSGDDRTISMWEIDTN